MHSVCWGQVGLSNRKIYFFLSGLQGLTVEKMYQVKALHPMPLASVGVRINR